MFWEWNKDKTYKHMIWKPAWTTWMRYYDVYWIGKNGHQSQLKENKTQTYPPHWLLCLQHFLPHYWHWRRMFCQLLLMTMKAHSLRFDGGSPLGHEPKMGNLHHRLNILRCLTIFHKFWPKNKFLQL